MEPMPRACRFFLTPDRRRCFDYAVVDDGSGEALVVPLRMDLSDGDAPDAREDCDENRGAEFESTLAEQQQHLKGCETSRAAIYKC